MRKKAEASRPPVGAPPLQASVAELRAIAHPLRLRILESFAEGPRTTKQVAELLGEPPTRLYHHVAALERAGLLKLKETRKNRGTVEKWFESIARTMSGATTAQVAARGGKNSAAATVRRNLARAVLEQSRQEVLTAMSTPDGEKPLLVRLVMVAPLARELELRKRLRDFVKQLQGEFHCAETEVPDESYERWAMTLTFSPCRPKATKRGDA
jgi:DNA-binding transcriptional ArsR family regulator